MRPIEELNAGLTAFREELMVDGLAVKRVELALVTFGPVHKLADFQYPDLFRPPQLAAEDDTPMGLAIEKAVSLVRERKAAYRQNGISYCCCRSGAGSPHLKVRPSKLQFQSQPHRARLDGARRREEVA